jgi:multidrug resistance efflux pump
MSVAFSRTMRSLHAERSLGVAFALSLAIFILAAWAAWLLWGRVSVYAVSTTARLEAGAASYPIQSLHAGRIATNHLVLGRKVRRGDVLVELDSNVQRLQYMEEKSQGASIDAELETLRRGIEAEQKAMQEEQHATELGIAEARARLREAEAAAAYAKLDAESKTKLHDAGLLSQIETARAVAEAKKQSAGVDGLALAIQRQEREQLARASERLSRIEALTRETNRLSGQQTKLGATLHRLTSEMELGRILAPTDGQIGEVSTFRAGDVIPAGEKLGAIVPEGSLKVVAQFAPGDALGRIRNGQPARLRFEGFPWTQYGALTAHVAKVANEVRDGNVRVELDPAPGFRVPLQHGLPGATEVEIERISPASLILRTAGQMLASRQGKTQTDPAQDHKK